MNPVSVTTDIRPTRSRSSQDVLDFARRMTRVGSVTVTSPSHPDLVEHRLAIHDAKAPGYTVVFLCVTDAIPEVTSVDFDLPDRDSMRHLPHSDDSG